MSTYTRSNNSRVRRGPFSRTFLLLAIGLVSLAMIQNRASAATYYLDSVRGNDTNPGTADAPWKTLARAYSWYGGSGPKVTDGDTVLLRTGNYGEFKEDMRDGPAHLFHRTDWITYKADAGQTPELSQILVVNKDQWGGTDHGTSYLRFENLRVAGTCSFQFTHKIHVKGCTIVGRDPGIQGYYGPYVYRASSAVRMRQVEDAIVEDCDCSHTCYGIHVEGDPNAGNMVIRDNVVHYTAEDSIRYSKMNNLHIEGNHIYDCVKYRTAADLYGTRNGDFKKGEVISQAGTGATGVYDAIPGSYIQVFQTSKTDFATLSQGGGTVTGTESGAILSNISKYDPVHRDGIDTHNPPVTNVTIRNNIVMADVTQGITVYGMGKADGYTIENNLIAGPTTPFMLQGVTNVKLNNNTAIEVRPGDGLRMLMTYNGAPHGVTIIEMYNNILPRIVQNADAGDEVSRIVAHGNNIFGNDPDGNGGPAYPFRRNATERVNNNIASLFVDPTGGNFRLNPEAMLAINNGDPTHQPSDSLGSVGPDGRICRDGPVRDASHHSIGCYEYGTAGSSRGPVLATIGNKNTMVGINLTFDVSATDPNGRALEYSATGLPTGANLSAVRFAWTPAPDQVGVHQVTFMVSNGVEQDSETITITVVAPEVPNTAPVLGAIGNKSMRENESLTFSISATDAENSPDALTYSASGLPSGATFSGHSFSWTPGYDQAGSHEITFVVSDGLAQNSETITVSVANVNRPPALTGISDRSVDENSMLAFTISASDPDGGSLTYSASPMPAGANFSGQSFTWTPTSDQVGVHQITFIASDGELQDSQTISVTVAGAAPDGTGPVVARSSPEPDAIQVPANNLVTLRVTDAGAGVKADSVVIRVNDQTIYQGDVQVYTGASGRCSRSGQKNDYRFIYQPAQSYDFDQVVTVSVSAADLQGNAMPEYSYSFMTEMRTFGANMQVGKSAGALREKAPVTATDSIGNIWIVWHDGPQGNRDIYAAKMVPGGAFFQTPVALTRDPQDQCNPDLAVGSDGKLYVVWQDNRRGNWDIFGSVCPPGQSFSRESRITDSNDNEINPAIAIDGQSPNSAYVAWQDDRNGNQDIYVAASANSFASNTVSRVTANTADQVDPDIAADAQNVLYIVWTDMRNGRADIYGAASNAGPWTNVPVITTTSDQANPVLASEPGGSVLHLLWVDNALGDQEVYYAKMEGLPGSPLTGRSIVDDTSGADQLAPAIVCATGGKVFACWQDSRHEGAYSTDTDLYVVELVSGTARTNVLVGDDQTNASQHEPAIGVNANAQPYVIWTDDRRGTPQIYYAATTLIDPVPLDSKLVVASAGATIGADPSAIDQPEDVSIVIPPAACQADLRMTISRILNPQNVPVECLGSYDFGPSGVDFDHPVTVTVPYRYANRGGRAKPYWYNSLTGALSQQGITDIENVEISSNLNALRFKTTHFTPFYLVAGDSGDGATQNGIDAYGGCSLSAAGRGSAKDLVVPCAVVAATIVVLRRRDRRRQRLVHDTEK